MSREDWIQVVHDRDHWTSCGMPWRKCFEFQAGMGAYSHNQFYESIADAVLRKVGELEEK